MNGKYVFQIQVTETGNWFIGEFHVPPKGQTAEFATWWVFAPSDVDRTKQLHCLELMRAHLSKEAGREINLEYYDSSTRVPAT